MAVAGPAPGLRTAHAINERERTSDVLTEENSNVDFASMFLSEPVTVGLRRVGFEKPSPIQLKAIPLGRCGLDLIVQAKSGTGKTCVFSVIALEGIDVTSQSTQVLVLAPTREIAVQIQDTIRAIGCEMEGLRCHVFIGGTLFGPDRQKLKKCHIAVGTPGRIKQLIEYEVLKTGTIRLFVLDEADKLLDDTFQEQVNWVYNHLSDNKQMLALSATYPEYLAKHLIKYMREPMFVRLNPKDLALRGIKQLYVELGGHSLPNKAFEIKVEKLLKILTQVSFNQCLIFSNLQTRAQNLCDILCDYGWPSECISGAQEQSQRLSAMAKLKKFQCRILISTDLTARGIDAENVNLIINLDIPTDSKTYLHRIGRAGRFGTHGAAISLASKGREMELLRNIQHQCRVIMTELPDPAPSDLLKQDLNPTRLQQASTSIASESLLTTNKIKLSRNTTTDDGDDSDTTYALEDALLTSSIGNQKEPKPKSIILNGTESNIISLVSYEQSSSKVRINGSVSDGKLKNIANSLLVKNTTMVVESTEDKCCIPETKRKALQAQKVDVCVQTITEDEVLQKTMAPEITDVNGSGDHKDRSTLLIGFEEVPEVRKLRLPRWVQIKRGDAPRRACTWYEGRESFDTFMRERTVKDGTRRSEDHKVNHEAGVITQTVQEHKELLVETSRHEGKSDDGDLTFPSGFTPNKDLRTDCGSQSRCKEEVQSGSENTALEIVHFPKETCGLTPILEIERYRALLYDLKLLNHEEIVTAVTKKEADSVESPTLVDNQVAREYGDGQASMQSLGSSKASSKKLHGTPENNVNQTPTVHSKTHETKDIDETVKVPHVDNKLHHQVSTDSLDFPSGNELKTETKSKSRNTTGGRKKGQQQRINQHVFQMSTLGALMSPKELDLALVSNPNISSCDGDLDTNDTDKEKLERFPPSNKVNQTHQVHHSKDLTESEQGDTIRSKNQVLGNEEIQILESHGNETSQNKQVKTSIQKNISQENDSSISSLDDPVWAIFKNFIPAALPLEVHINDTKLSVGKETSSEESSSSFCESDTSTCSASSSEDDSGNSETDEEEESVDELQGKELALNGNGKDEIEQKNKVRLKKSAKSGSWKKENCNYDGHNKDGQYLVDSNWRTEPPYGCNVEGFEYDQSHAYYAAAPNGDTTYYGWQYPGYSTQFYPNTTYRDDYYHRHAQQPYPGYPYFSSYLPYYT